MGVFLYLQDHIGSWQDTSNPAKDNNEPCSLSSAILPSSGGRENLFGPHHSTSTVLASDLVGSMSLSSATMEQEWVGRTWLPPLDQDIVDTYSINSTFVTDLLPICLT